MSNLVKDINIPWGEDLVALRKQGGDIAEVAERKLYSGYLLQIRDVFGANLDVRQVIANSVPATNVKSDVLEKLKYLAKSGSEDIFEKALEEALNEVDMLRKAGIGLVLVDSKTGKSLMPMTPDMLYTPPDYIGEDGKLHQSKPILHPKISSTLGLHAYEQAKNLSLLKKAADPKTKLAYEHLADPNKIADMAIERLKNIGVSIQPDLNVDATDYEFGREHVEAIEQGVNNRFHRANMYAAILATKILQACGSNGSCSLGPVRSMKNAKNRWYLISVKTSLT